ncbi:hypothetical protein JTE90_009700 [Oedothorax gibbosus]|uniref:Uncharacterized protein n=1 Tax=Oedothorax gibbosus TaxID=931172 RepID=A0AAV6V7T3_9ARAC|nr:hypothetical protein JTE90_009700 [Oedothorax gibbosus]
MWREYLPGNPEGVPTVDNDPTWKCVCTLCGQYERAVFDVSWWPNLDLIATGSGDNYVRVFREMPDQIHIREHMNSSPLRRTDMNKMLIPLTGILKFRSTSLC